MKWITTSERESNLLLKREGFGEIEAKSPKVEGRKFIEGQKVESWGLLTRKKRERERVWRVGAGEANREV